MRAASIVLGLVAVSGDAWAEAEHYEPIRVDAGMTGAIVPSTDGSGVGFVVEIKNYVHDSIAIGGRIDLSVLFGGHIDEQDVPFGMSAAGLIKAEYLLGLAAVRPFVGLGAGIYSMASHTFGDDGVSTSAGRYFGVAPAAGIDLGRVRLAATYNAILGTSVEYVRTDGSVDNRSQSYLSLELSFRFGGGRKPSPP